jgi:hypothetical protein
VSPQPDAIPGLTYDERQLVYAWYRAAHPDGNAPQNELSLMRRLFLIPDPPRSEREAVTPAGETGA